MVENFSWFFFAVDNPFRKRLLKFVRWRWFERIVIFVIVTNCVMLALYNPLDRQCLTKQCKILEKVEHFVFAFFVAEMLIKMTAMGVLGREGYFGDKWNILDCLIVIAGIVDMAASHEGGFLTIIRLGRVLRPLRAINRVPSIRILVTLLMDTVPMLANVLILAFLVFSCFGIMGVQMFQGKLRNRCFMSNDFNQTNLSYYGRQLRTAIEHSQERHMLCFVNISSSDEFDVHYPDYFVPATSEDYLCHLEHDHGAGSCNDVPTDYDFKLCQTHYKSNSHDNTTNTSCSDPNQYYRTCKQEGPNPHYGSISFDNIAMAFVFIYQVVTLEGWSDLMYLIQDVYNFWTWIYFVVLISVGSFFLVNLALVVITMQFAETKRRETCLIKQQRSIVASQLSLYSDLRSMWSYIRQCCQYTKRFRSVHHIHQHVHLYQKPYFCNQCRSYLNNSDDSSLPPIVLKPPNIEISFVGDESASLSSSSQPTQRSRSASFPGSFPTSLNFQLTTIGNNKTQQRDCISISNATVDCSSKNKPLSVHNKIEYDANKNYLLPNQKYKSGSVKSNTICVHAESVSEVTVNRGSSNSIISQTSLSLKVNSSNGDVIQTNSHLGTDFSTNKAQPRKLSDMSMRSDTDYESSSDFCYGSMFDIQKCDKYYVSEEPTMIQKFRLFCKRISENTQASYFVMVVIVLNTLCMAVEHHNQPEKMTTILDVLNVIFIWIFTMEMMVKMLGIGMKAYFNLAFNCFDFFIVVLSIIELVIESGSSGSFIVFRSLRLLRIFRLIRPIRHQITVMLRTTSSVMTFFALLFLFMFTFAILGMNIFGGKFVFTNKLGEVVRSRSNFDSFLWSMVTVFQILTQEDWNLVMYDGIRATSTWATIYFLSLMTIGYYVLLNLLVAILVEGFTTPLEKKRMAHRLETLLRQKSKNKMKRTLSLPDLMKDGKSSDEPDTENIDRAATARLENRRCTLGVVNFGHLKNIFATMKSNSGSDVDEDVDIQQIDCTREKPKKNDPILLSARSTKYHGAEEEMVEWCTSWDGSATSVDEELLDVINTKWYKRPQCTIRRKNWSLYMFSEQNSFRCLLGKVTDSKFFDWFIFILIVYSCVLLALESPDLDRNGQTRNVIDTSQLILTWAFVCEMLMKAIAVGFVIGKDTYLHNGWNVLDFVLVIGSLTDVIFTLCSNNEHTLEIVKGIRVLRATRALRPLRMIRKAPGLKLVVQTLLYSLKPIGNTILIAGIFFLVFAILGVQLLKGSFYYCFGVEPGSINNKTECVQDENGYWINHQYNFDNLFEALMALFVVSTKDGWVDIMRRGIDARGVDLEPQINYSSWRLVYFISFLLIGGFLVLNMIVGVVVENFQRCQELQGDREKSKDIIDKWKQRLLCNRTTYWQQYSPVRKQLYKLCTHTYWEMGITAIIFANILIMSTEHYQMSQTFHSILEISNLAFTVCYVFEAVLLIAAFGPKRYFKDKWYCFDMFIVVVSVGGIVLENVDMEELHINPSAIKAIRVLRVVRALKLLKVAKGLRFLLDHVAKTVPQVSNLGLLFSLLFFVYSCLGMQLFSTLECSNRYPCAGLGRHANFKTLGSSMLTLFRIATGDNWNGILKDTLRASCDDSIECKENCCTSRYISPLFFVSFVLFAQFVLVNIVIAVLMRHLQIPQDKMKRKSSERESGKKKETPPSLQANTFLKWQGLVKQKLQGQYETQTTTSENSLFNTSPLLHTPRASNRKMKVKNKLQRKYSCPDKIKLDSSSKSFLSPSSYLINKPPTPLVSLPEKVNREKTDIVENEHLCFKTDKNADRNNGMVNNEKTDDNLVPLLKWQTDMIESDTRTIESDIISEQYKSNKEQYCFTVEHVGLMGDHISSSDDQFDLSDKYMTKTNSNDFLRSSHSSFTIAAEDTNEDEVLTSKEKITEPSSVIIGGDSSQEDVFNVQDPSSLTNISANTSDSSSLRSFIIIGMEEEDEKL